MIRDRVKSVAPLYTALVLIFSSAVTLANSDSMEERLRACTACHQPANARAADQSYAPDINGKPAEYLYQQLLNYREGRRLNTIMGPMLAYLSPEYLREIAAYFSQQPIGHRSRATAGTAPMSGADQQIALRGQQLVQESTTERPACVACHGSDLRGDGVAIPGLRELSPAYISAQLGAWQSDTRHARQPDCMADVANALSGEDINAVAHWIANAASLPTRAVAQAVAIGELPAPCGAVQ